MFSDPHVMHAFLKTGKSGGTRKSTGIVAGTFSA